MTYSPSELVLRAWNHPPKCLAAFTAQPVRSPLFIADIHDELAVFGVSCGCGSGQWAVLGHPHAKAGLLCPISLRCSECGANKTLFDVAKHGYDAEFGHQCVSMRGAGPATAFACGCSGEVFEVHAAFSYQIEPVDDLGDEAISHIEDYFDGFSLALRCAGCGVADWVSEYECA